MCNIMNGLVPVSSLLLIRLLPCCITSGSACVTGIVAANISWGRRWHCCVAATTRLWRSRFTISRSESPPLPTRCGVRFSLLLLPLPPSVCPLDDLAPFSTLELNDKLDDPNAKAWDPTLTGSAAFQEHWRWTELLSKGTLKMSHLH